MLRPDRLLARRRHWRPALAVLAAVLTGCVSHGPAVTAPAPNHPDAAAPAPAAQVPDQVAPALVAEVAEQVAPAPVAEVAEQVAPAPVAQAPEQDAPAFAAPVADQDARAAALRTTAILKIAPYITAEGKGRRYRIGVVGTDAVATAALRELPGKKVDHASVTVSAVESMVAASGAAAGDFDLLWIAASIDDTTLRRIVAAHADEPVVVVSERSGFAALGGGVQLFARDNCVRFELNAEALKKQGLRPSAQLLKLSRKGPAR